ncbi:hypothetical protein HPP92_000237 [Vanilla planifolia]|uniref:30S ribosomal protein S21, chloroplastic n=1 Tax=Vanilla planifolia TaxID=51239 RepID=A0A835VE74_VANPL|nr:hypothetical protein HPP92_000223 [Vanilla planifolia]KAG0500165.1 hypothetical protein HPP92_000237 [Vanilla planifolia]
MATIPTLLPLPIHQNPTFLSPLSWHRFIVPNSFRNRFSTFSTAIVSSSSVKIFRPLATAEPIDYVSEEDDSELSDDEDFSSFGSGYNVQIIVEEDESEDSIVQRFRREVAKSGIIQECRRRRFFENKQEKRKRKKREAARRNRRRRFPGVQLAASSAEEVPNAPAAKKVDDDLDDDSDEDIEDDSSGNWKDYDVELPY